MYCEFIPGFGWQFLGFMLVFILENLLARTQLQITSKNQKETNQAQI